MMTDAFIMCFVKWPENTVDDFLGHFGESRCFENPQTRENPMRFPVYDKHHFEPKTNQPCFGIQVDRKLVS